MFNFNGPAVLWAAACFGLLLLLSLLLASRDTMRGFRELFDLRIIRNFLRSMLRCRPQFSLASVLVIAAIAPPIIVLVVRECYWPGVTDFLFILGYALIVVCPLVYWFFAEAFGQMPRHRWRSYQNRRNGLDGASQEPQTPPLRDGDKTGGRHRTAAKRSHLRW